MYKVDTLQCLILLAIAQQYYVVDKRGLKDKQTLALNMLDITK